MKRTMTTWEIILAPSCLGLALMAHPGSIFSLAAFTVIVFRYRALFPIRKVIAASAILAAYILPWSAYQKFVDPPGNRLIKMHLAEELSIDSRSAMQGIVDAYRNHPLSDILYFKWTNIQQLGGHKPLDTFGLGDFSTRGGIHLDRAATERSRIAQREWIWNAVGLLNLGWIAWLVALFKRKRQEIPIPFAGWLVAAVVVNFVFWALITFGPWETVTTHSSYADILLLSVGLLGFVLTLPRFVWLSLLALQIFNLSVIWIWSFPQKFGISDGLVASALQWPLLFLGALITALLLSIFIAPGNYFKNSTCSHSMSDPQLSES